MNYGQMITLSRTMRDKCKMVEREMHRQECIN
jgi:hypothetical protein